MKKISNFLLSSIMLIVCVTTFSSCYTTKTGLHSEEFIVNDFPKFRKQCIGQTYNQIVTKLGAPQRREPDGTGGNILIYENTTTTSISNAVATAYNVNYFTRTYTPGVATSTQQVSQTDYVHYFVNSDNVCYEVKTNIPMTRTETRTVDGKYKKISWGKTLWWCIGFPASLGTVLGVILGLSGS